VIFQKLSNLKFKNKLFPGNERQFLNFSEVMVYASFLKAKISPFSANWRLPATSLEDNQMALTGANFS